MLVSLTKLFTPSLFIQVPVPINKGSGSSIIIGYGNELRERKQSAVRCKKRRLKVYILLGVDTRWG